MTPRSLVLAMVVATACWLPFQCLADSMEMTTIYIVRHAEKTKDADDPPLTGAGRARAEELAFVLGDEEIAAVFTTPFRRTRQTGAPVAAAAGLTAKEYREAEEVASTILGDYVGKRVVVVGHSNTVDDLAAAFGATGLSDLAETEYDHLFVVHHSASGAHLDRLRYGDAAR